MQQPQEGQALQFHPNLQHGVMFNIGTDVVVCGCGLDFRSIRTPDDRVLDGLSQFARHIRAMTGLQPMQPPPEPALDVDEEASEE